MKKRAYTLLILPVVAIVLEALPYGAVLNFADESQTYRETFSYFSLTPYGYANFGPLIAAVLTCVALLLVKRYCHNLQVCRWSLEGLALYSYKKGGTSTPFLNSTQSKNNVVPFERKNLYDSSISCV